MNLFAPLERALAEQNYIHPTPIQKESIPPAVEGSDILGCAKTGTGKTAAFALPILDFIGHERPRTEANRPSALVLVPTRELAIQIAESFRRYGKYMRCRQTVIYGGVSQEPQIRSLNRGVDIVIATPGRLLDLMTQGHVDLRNVEMFVLDEADRMLDMGFLPALRKIVAELPRERQSLFFSATLPSKIRALAAQLLFNPLTVTVVDKKERVQEIEQSVRFLQRGDKLAELSSLLSQDSVDRTIVFTRTKHAANRLAKQLDRAGFRSNAIHGNKTQSARQKALDAFRDKKCTVLVATDVAARGIDIQGVTHVVNYDMPVDPESYIHRIGRTGRAGADGIAISFCTPDELDELHAVEKRVGNKLRAEGPEFTAEDLSSAKQQPSAGSKSKSRSPRSKSKPRNSGQNRLKKGASSNTSARNRKRQRAPVT